MNPDPKTPKQGAKSLMAHRGFVVVAFVVAGVIFAVLSAVLEHQKSETRRQELSDLRAYRVRQLSEIGKELEGLEAIKRQELLLYARKRAADASADATARENSSLEAQREIVAALETSARDFALFAGKRSNASFDRVLAAHETAADLHCKILSGQQEALGILALQQPGHEAVAAQQEARDAQMEVGAALKELAEARGMARGSRLRTRDEQQYDHHTYHVARAERRLAEIPRNLTTMAVRERQLAEMERDVAKELEVSVGDALAKLELQATTVREALADVGKRKAEAEKLLGESKVALVKHQPKVAELKEVLDREPIPPTPQDEKAASLQQDVIALQRRAIDLQASALAALGDLPATVDEEGLMQALAALEEPVSASQDVARPPDAVALEQEIRVAFRKIHAMEQMMIGRLQFADAVSSTNPVPLKRLTQSPDEKVGCDEMSSMVVSAQAMLEQARRMVSVREQPEHRREMVKRLEKYATADCDDPARDLTGLWNGADDARCGLLPGGPGGPPCLDAQTVSLPAFSMLHREVSPPPAWLFADHWHVLGPFDNSGRANLDTSFVAESVVDLQATYPGKNGVAIGWEPVQSEIPNVMPPFRAYNNARRIEGLDEKTAHLHNLQFAVYYAYTELRFEEACDRWLAIGSDDSSKVWINDQPVWISGKNTKAWTPTEGYRKVHFNAGVNRVLYRIENGSDRTEFSLLIGMQP
ncbi:hypothetical protein OKA05_20950 [Luteolibacter arcticus]|uniref:PA14 domain-containing protein n=1 Tax=Luteolibacter arcticus TaxID=1581411 RepID=A0ABT3GNF5_9BACT|nr:hypothetical protein [Luteolibacter arcticus]MCW1925042.1 hypothetical protein [Luteolibacter arcticus]